MKTPENTDDQSPAFDYLMANFADIEATYPGEWVVLPDENPSDLAHSPSLETAQEEIRQKYKGCEPLCHHIPTDE